MEVGLKEAGIDSDAEIQSVALWATNGTETLAEQTVQGADLPGTVTWELPEGESAQGEWTIHAQRTVMKAGEDVSENYEAATSSFQANESEPHPTATPPPQHRRRMRMNRRNRKPRCISICRMWSHWATCFTTNTWARAVDWMNWGSCATGKTSWTAAALAEGVPERGRTGRRGGARRRCRRARAVHGR